MPRISEITRDKDGKLPAFVWPGGYPMHYITKDMGILCPGCANGENGSLAAEKDLDPRCPDDAQWLVIEGDIHWEGLPLVCDHCGREIESAYGCAEDDA